MKERTNSLGQPIGNSLDGWQACAPPPRSPITGRYCRVEPIDAARHAQALYQANLDDREQRLWTYLPYGPFATLAGYTAWLESACLGNDPMFHTIVDLSSDRAVGVASLMRINAPVGVIEVGHINYSPRLQKTRAATEAMFLMMRRVFDELGYRRYEWKCDALNAGSRASATRLGFSYEGTFCQATIYKNRNRDTAWYAIVDHQWPRLKACFEQWLHPDNFDARGGQQTSLSALVGSAHGEAGNDGA